MTHAMHSNTDLSFKVLFLDIVNTLSLKQHSRKRGHEAKDTWISFTHTLRNCIKRNC